MGKVGERLCRYLIARCRIGISVWIGCFDDDFGIRIPRSIIIKVVHDEITIPLAHEPIGYTLAVLMMIACGKGILTLSAEAPHQIFLAILYGYNTPMTGSIEDIGYQDIPVVCQLPIPRVFLAVEIGLRTEQGHLLALIPEGSLVIAVADAGTHKTVYIISVRGAADVDVRLPDIATSSSMTMLHHILALIIDLVVAGKMSMAAEEFVTALKLFQQRKQERETGRRIMPLLIGIGQRLCLAERRITKGKRNMITEYHLHILWREGEILLQPLHLALT